MRLPRPVSSIYHRGRHLLKTRRERHFPERLQDTPDELLRSRLMKSWWYYSVELLPGVTTKGVYPSDLAMIPRLMMRRCALEGMSCLDVGTMEGIIPVLMRRGGAKDVLAVDAVDHCDHKLKAVKHYHNVDFEFETVGSIYQLDEKLEGRAFDLINYSGLLYHVFSPLMALCGVRPLMKRNGLLIVSTNVVLEDGYSMEFNNGGRMQTENNTFWYISVKLFDYLLRYLKLAPQDCIYVPHTAVKSDIRYTFEKRSGYLSVLCRASDEPLATSDDEWMRNSAAGSWEYQWNVNWQRAARQPKSKIRINGDIDKSDFRKDLDCLDLWQAANNRPPLTVAQSPSDSHLLRLSDKF